MRPANGLTLGLAIALALGASSAAAAAAEEDDRARMRPTGFRIVGGLVVPENADKAFEWGGDIALGSVIRPWVNLSLGATRWSADIDRSGLASDVSGTIRDFSLHTDFTVDLFEASGVEPYVGLGVALHAVDAKIASDPSLEDALKGTNAGLGVLAGVASSAGALRLSAEGRREFADDVDHWSFLVGIGTRWDKKKEPGTESGRARGTSAPQVAAGDVPPAAVEPTAASRLNSAGAAPGAAPAPASPPAIEQLRADNRALRDRLVELERQVADQRQRATEAELVRLRAEQDRLRSELQALRGGPASGPAETLALQDTREGLLLSLPSSTLFEPGSSRIQADAADDLERVAAVLARFPGAIVVVEGHTDGTGDPTAGLRLSQQRADAVAAVLHDAGIGELTSVGFGADRPVADERDPAGVARNRRVEIRVLPRSSAGSAP